MQDILGESLKNLRWVKANNKRLSAVLLVLSLIVSLNVFWALRQPGLTLAGDASCGIVEHHHTDECCTQLCICEIPEGSVHEHGESCYETRYYEQQEIKTLHCTLETAAHEHGEGCYSLQLTPALEISQLACEEVHEHTELCYVIISTEPVEELVLSCTLDTAAHEHGDGCYTTAVIEGYEEQVLVCAMEETPHVHGEGCYGMDISCGLKEHSHGTECYSDQTADVESLLNWQNMFAGYPYTGDLRHDLVGIAKTQVGYTESTANFEVSSDGVRRGYTRYGAWYGTPYRDWSAAFVSFCLSYAGANDMQNPGNIGANAMAELWRNLGKYASAGEYSPVPGDLVFFNNNSVGIVAEVHSATVYVIRGDVENSVRSDAISLGDSSIAGWGITVLPEEINSPNVPLSAMPDISLTELLDISKGPVFYIFANSNNPLQMQSYSLKSSREIKDLANYLGTNGGTLRIMLYNSDDTLLEPGEDGKYHLDATANYKLNMRIFSPSGIHPGTYRYQLPAGVSVTSGGGVFELLDPNTGVDVEVGTWDVTTDGLITLSFNNNMINQSGIEIPATMGIKFIAWDDPIFFDGNITVTVNPPPDADHSTKLLKFGQQGNENDTQGKTDPSKIYWTVKVEGNRDSHIPGSIMTDRISKGDWDGVHYYTELDMAAGIQFGVTDQSGHWVSWKVYPDNPALIWTADGWKYTIPETAVCPSCGSITLGNENWTYYVTYTSTPDPAANSGVTGYKNYVTLDAEEDDGWAEFIHYNTSAEIAKQGSFMADAAGGYFNWEISATVPAYKAGEKSDFWHIMDYMYLVDSHGSQVGSITNDADKASITASFNGSTYNVPYVLDATEADLFAWHLSWSPTDGSGTVYGREIDLLQRCACTAETCPWWDDVSGCGSKPWVETGAQSEHFCRCFTNEHDTTFTITYKTDDLSLIENFGGAGNRLRNRAELYYWPVDKSAKPKAAGTAEANVTIPGLFKKTLTQNFNGYTAHYNITVNEAKLSLTDGFPLYILDEMTETLAYISGSMVITAEDAEGNTTVLKQGRDYTITYDGSGTRTDTDGNPVHVLEVTLLQPQPMMYTLDYDATLIIPNHSSGEVIYGNSASITLWGKSITDESPDVVYTGFGISGESYKVQLHKTCSNSGEPLEGAVFGLFNDQGGQSASGVTDEEGRLLFQTNIVEGIILHEHVPYYLQELQAPPGYQLDDTEHWFVFCNNAADTCDQCTTVMGNRTAVRIPYGQIGPLNITNEIMNYDLPATGGSGIYPLVMASVTFIVTPLAYFSVEKFKRKRQDEG